LRRALSRFGGGELTPKLKELGNRFLIGAARNGIDSTSAEAAFKQLAGFAGYGLCKSHAASFALIAYQTCWLKQYHPAPFYCALLNQQPMGFYSPEVIIGDMRRHGVELWPPDINLSDWNYRIEAHGEAQGLRTGLRAVHGMGEEAWERVHIARDESSFTNLFDLCNRTRLPRDLVSDLIRSGVLVGMGDRRELLWQLGELLYHDEELPFVLPVSEVELPELGELEQTSWEYELLGLSPAGQAMRHYRAALERAGVLTTAQVKQQRDGRRARVGGMQVIRQRPPTAKGLMFMSLEDETGLLDVVVQAKLYEQCRTLLRTQKLLLVEGVIQQGSGSTSLMSSRIYPLYAE
jgi:error-prone DNA polymerase